MSYKCDYDITHDHSAKTKCGFPAVHFYAVGHLVRNVMHFYAVGHLVRNVIKDSLKMSFIIRCKDHPRTGGERVEVELEDLIITEMTEAEFEVAQVHES